MDYNGYVEKYGAKAVGRAEMLAAMDCLMHHLKDQLDLEQWCMNALPQKLFWHVLDNEPIASSTRLSQYVMSVKDMSDSVWDCIVHTFADIVQGQCFGKIFHPDAFKSVVEAT